MTIVLGASLRISSITLPMSASSSISESGIVAEMRPAGEVRRRVGRVVHLEVVHVHEERLRVVGVILDIFDRVGGLILVEGGHPRVVDPADALGRLAGHALPLAQVHVFAEILLELGLKDGNQGWNHFDVSS